jgi:hypothetical protein
VFSEAVLLQLILPDERLAYSAAGIVQVLPSIAQGDVVLLRKIFSHEPTFFLSSYHRGGYGDMKFDVLSSADLRASHFRVHAGQTLSPMLDLDDSLEWTMLGL